MIRKAWTFMGSTGLTFWLICAIGVTMYIGSLIASANFTFFEEANTLRIQDWFFSRGVGEPGKTWWLPLLFLLFAGLGANTIACAMQRVSFLWSRRANFAAKQFLILMTPSMVHIVFLVMLSGHFLTFTLYEYRRIPIQESTRVDLLDGRTAAIKTIERERFPNGSLLHDRVRQVEVELEIGEGPLARSTRLGFLSPVYDGDVWLQLDLERKKMKEARIDPTDESCNKERNFHMDHVRTPGMAQVYLVQTRDPGFLVLLPCFGLVILMMALYFAAGSTRRAEKI
ncbi:MAG: hypothetical protein EPN93_15315 [Spirochaetes bacterium]|nr:MAG: hypothetical protein EPN93_15315 [Spirochaetota bacterium]